MHHAVTPIVMALEKYVPQPYAGEIRGMASHLGGSLSDVIILNFAYEVSAYVRLPNPNCMFVMGTWCAEQKAHHVCRVCRM